MPDELIITEKPNAAQKIAQALAEGPPEKLTKNGAAYYKITRNKKEILVVPAVGHLFILDEEKKSVRWTYPVFDVKWKPIFENKNNYWAKKYFQNIKSLCKDVKSFVAACDYDIEGSTIAYNILRFVCGVEDGKRMRFSTLTKSDLIEAYEEASPHLDYPQIEAGLTRHYLDYLWGINSSRALTIALQSVGGYKTLSTGRVQGPTLNIVLKRQKEIDAFVPKDFWELTFDGSFEGQPFLAKHREDKFWEKEKVENAHKNCVGTDKALVEKLKKKEYNQNPPFPFDLTTLQREAYANFGYSPKQTLDIAQSLYEQALISYPRTSSQKLSPKIGYKTILKNLAQQKHYTSFCTTLLEKKTLKPTEGKKNDPAHPAVYPTGNKPNELTKYQRNVYDLIVKRFFAVFADPAKRQSIRADLNLNGEIFVAEGITTLVANWIDYYKPYAKFKETLLPAIKEGDTVNVEKLDIAAKQTQPPGRYTQATVLREMEKRGLGTKATRALILQTLYDRGYIEDKSIVVTELGKSVATSLEDHCSEILSAELTKKFEEEMEAILEGKRKREDIVKEARDVLGSVLKKFKDNQQVIGKELLDCIKEEYKRESTIGKCTCGETLTIRMSKAKKRFVGCTGYPKCTETFSLPQRGSLKVLKEECKDCQLHVISVKAAKRKAWKLCVKDGYR